MSVKNISVLHRLAPSCYITMRQIYVLSLSVVYIHCDGRCNACNAVGSAASCISIGGLQSQIWMIAKIAELQQSVKVHREKSGTFSRKVSAKLNVLPQDATQPQPLQCPLGCLEVFNFSTRIPYFLVCSCEQKIQKRWLSESRMRYLLVWELVRKVWHAARLRASQGKQNVLQKWQENQCDFFRLLQYSRRTRQ